MDRLISLTVAGLQMTSNSVIEIARRCVNLQSVSFSFTDVLEDTYRQFIQLRGSGLKILVFSWVNSIG